MGCPIQVGIAGLEPYVIMTENCTNTDGSTEYKVTGLSVDIVKLVCEKMNLTVVFLTPSLNVELNTFIKAIAELEDGISDVLTGTFPLVPFVVTS
jgi:hypothetical protein